MSSHKLLIRKLVLICIAMFGFGFALVPLYDVFCRYTGINGKTENKAAPAARRVDDSRNISVEFLANRDPGIPWDFAPEITSGRITLSAVLTIQTPQTMTPMASMVCPCENNHNEIAP